MRSLTLAFLATFLVFAATLPAETSPGTVIKRSDDPIVAKRAPTPSDLPAISQMSSGGDANKIEQPTTFYILPFVKILDAFSDGDFTLLAVRNESDAVGTINIDFFPPNSAGTATGSVSNAMLPKEVWTLNLRGVNTGLPIDQDGFQRGWARITSSDAVFSADYFQLDPFNDFAAGSRPVDLDSNEFCQRATVRFLVGGGFTGGTKLFFMLDQPLGGDPNTDPPSVTGNIFDEGGNFIDDFVIHTDNFSLEVDVADIQEIVGAGVNFGSIDFTFENAFAGGYVHAEYKANNRFSVSVKGVCLDSLAI